MDDLNADVFTAEREAQIEDQTTTLVFNSNKNLSLANQREKLPIKKYANQILYCLENFQTVVIVGECGSGKSTQIPQYLYEHGWHTKGIIGITQPRRISAVTLANRVSEEMGDVVGQTVGFSVRFMAKCSEETRIKYMTEGILMREMMANPLLTNYSVIMIDEAHERSVLTDCVLGLLKKIAKRRSNLKIIISSATMDAELFRDFFNFRTKQNRRDTAKIVTVEGRMYETEVFYLERPCPDYVRETVDTILKIHQTEGFGDILAFLTGQEEVQQAINMLKDFIEAAGIDDEKIKIMPMHGSLTNHDQLKVFFHVPRGVRKVIIATNIAETS